MLLCRCTEAGPVCQSRLLPDQTELKSVADVLLLLTTRLHCKALHRNWAHSYQIGFAFVNAIFKERPFMVAMVGSGERQDVPTCGFCPVMTWSSFTTKDDQSLPCSHHKNVLTLLLRSVAIRASCLNGEVHLNVTLGHESLDVEVSKECEDSPWKQATF